MISGEVLGDRHRRDVVSLWDIVESFPCSEVARLTGLLSTLHTLQEANAAMAKSGGPIPIHDPLPSNVRQFWLGEIRDFLPILALAGMPLSAKGARELIRLLEDPSPHACSWVNVGQFAIELKKRVVDELEIRSVFLMTDSQARHYTHWKDGWGAAVLAFASASGDMEAASKAMACELPTASAFHSMRVVEVGLTALVKRVCETQPRVDNPNWNHWLQPLENQLSPQNKAARTTEWTSDPQFYADTTTRLLGVRDAWRNPTMHVDRVYLPREAGEVLTSSQMFMTRLAEKFR